MILVENCEEIAVCVRHEAEGLGRKRARRVPIEAEKAGVLAAVFGEEGFGAA